MNSIIFLGVGGLIMSAFTVFGQIHTGNSAPDFTLPSVQGKEVKLSDNRGKIVVLEWFNMGCPFVQKHYKAGDMQALQQELTGKGVVWLTINSTNPKHRDYLSPEKAAAQAAGLGSHATALLLDSNGKVGRAYGSKTTPHFFIVDQSGKLAYQGAIDDAPGMSADPKKAVNYVRAATAELLANQPVRSPETKPYGCGVKYAD